jgi:hypothetical protein
MITSKIYDLIGFMFIYVVKYLRLIIFKIDFMKEYSNSIISMVLLRMYYLKLFRYDFF